MYIEWCGLREIEQSIFSRIQAVIILQIVDDQRWSFPRGESSGGTGSGPCCCASPEEADRDTCLASAPRSIVILVEAVVESMVEDSEGHRIPVDDTKRSVAGTYSVGAGMAVAVAGRCLSPAAK